MYLRTLSSEVLTLGLLVTVPLSNIIDLFLNLINSYLQFEDGQFKFDTPMYIAWAMAGGLRATHPRRGWVSRNF